mgnify:CR=1 FL=1
MASSIVSEETYEKKFLDKLSDKLVDGVANIINKVRPGWIEKNKSKIDEWKLMFYAFNRSPPGIIGAILIISFITIGLFGPYLAPYSYREFLYIEYPDTYLVPPGASITITNDQGEIVKVFHFPLGTDKYGRDLLSLILYGARVSLIVSLIVIILGVPVGILLGLVAGYFGGKVDEVIMRITDIFLAFPALILAIAFASVLPERIRPIIIQSNILKQVLSIIFAADIRDAANFAPILSVILAIILVWWPAYTRIIRGSVLSARENLYVEAARALGVSTWKILFKHILPNIISPVLVLITLDIGAVILMEAALSFLGLGAQDPMVDWGKIVYDGAQYFPDRWWLVIFPGLATFLAVLGWNLIGDTLRDVLDPRTRRSIEFKVKKKKKQEM